MTDIKPLLTDEKIRDEAEEFTVNPISTDSFRQGFRLGSEYTRTLYEAERNRLLDEIARLVAEIHALKVCVTDTEYAWHDLALAAKEYMDAEGAGGTFDAGRVREARARLKELVENPE